MGSGGPPLVLAPEIDEDNMSALEKRKRDLQRTLANAEKGLQALKAKEDPTPVAADNNGGNVDKDFINQAYDEDLDEGAGFVVYEPPDSDEDDQPAGADGDQGKTGLKARMGAENEARRRLILKAQTRLKKSLLWALDRTIVWR